MDRRDGIRVLVVGGSGVFGSRLAEGLVRDGVAGVAIAGRSEGALRETAGRIGCGWVVLDIRGADLETQLREMAPEVVVDATGPFQLYPEGDPYRLARAALASGAHAVDFSDDAPFTAGISALEAEAQAAGRAAISGVSSVPALSAAAVHALSEGMERIDLIDSMILPGNRAPRGRSVMAAILAQAGRLVPGSDRTGWIGAERIRVHPATGPAFTRLASPIGAPDLVLMPERFGARAVRFRAGLELTLMHRGLEVLAWAVKAGVLRRAERLLPVVFPMACLLEPFGTDVGAMRVMVRGVADGQQVERIWTLTAEAGDGPHVPAIPGRVLVHKLLAGEVSPGARACLDEMTLAECEAAAPERRLSFGRESVAFTPLFKSILGGRHGELPREIRDLHDVAGIRRWHGVARVERGRGWLARLIARVFRFPPEAKAVPVSVTMERWERHEVWTRDFGGSRFTSHLRADPARPGRMWERFGPFRFAIDFGVSEGRLGYPVAAGRFLGIPLPAALLPRSETVEGVDAEGRVTFDVGLSAPLAGRVVRYSGWLVPDQPISGDQESAVAS